MPKGKTPSLIGFSNGRPKRVVVVRKSACARCGCAIEASGTCFDIPKKSAGFTKECRHCEECYKAILDQTQKELEELKSM